MHLPADQRRTLGAFLRTRREGLSPVSTGLPATGRRRTPGLRREEVAQLSGLSTTWLTWAEQGRDVALSDHALSRLAAALQMTSAERAYLFELTRKRDPQPPKAAAPVDAPGFGAAVHAMTCPAYGLDPLWNVFVWNGAAARLFQPWFTSGETNLLRFVFLDPAARRLVSDWPERAERLIAEFRVDVAHEPEDPTRRALVEELSARSPFFAGLWARQGVLFREGGLRRFEHPDDGPVAFTQLTLLAAADSRYKLVMLVPAAPEPRSDAVA